ncbi:MAG: RNA polymerase sigma factor [Candidatus Aminicenantes bacterium]|jgi:RNA polymerase sigma-70 factor (ECF subfamily)
MKKEEELIEEVLRGNHDSFEPLLTPYRQGMLNIAYRMSGNREEAKEICQEAVIKIFKYLRSYKRGRIFKNWIYKTVMNCSYDHLKKRRRFDRVIEEQKSRVDTRAFNPEKRFLNLELREKIRRCLRVLSPKEKAVFLLRDGEGLSVKETSRVLGSSSVSIRTHLSRARQKLRVEFERYEKTKKGVIES